MIPELSNGFDESQQSAAAGLQAVSFFTEEIPSGIYKLHIVLEALQDISCLFLFTGRKQLRACISLKKGERLEQSFWQSAAEIIPRYHSRSYPVQNLFFTYCTANPAAVRAGECYAEAFDVRADAETRRIFLCGDSTVTDHAGTLPYHPGACYAAWGQALPAFLSGRIAVENQAHCGLTTEDFQKEGHFDLVKRYICPGELCLIQFAHNDQKLPHLLADREYPMNLRQMIRELRRCRAVPVLVTPLGRNIWKADGTYYELLGEHTQAMKEVAAEMAVPCIDLHAFSVDFIQRKGMEEAENYFHPGDYTHTNEYGAYVFAGFIARELYRLFPEEISVRKLDPNGFRPPKNLWKKLGIVCANSHSGIQKSGGNRRERSGNGHREEFDAMEKSTASLLAAIQAAKAAEMK